LPQKTVSAPVKEWGAHSIAGNVEQQLYEDADDCGCDFKKGSRCDGFSKLWYPYAKGRLSQTSIDWMGKLADCIHFNYANKKVSVIHGSYHTISEYVFKSTPLEIKRNNFAATESDVILAGHSGLPFHQSIDDKLWLNAGVIGMPANDSTPDVWYMLLDDSKGALEFSHKSLSYDHTKANEQMKANHLPIEYAQTLISGLWDNMEILPEAEKKEQGIPLQSERFEKIRKDYRMERGIGHQVFRLLW